MVLILLKSCHPQGFCFLKVFLFAYCFYCNSHMDFVALLISLLSTARFNSIVMPLQQQNSGEVQRLGFCIGANMTEETADAKPFSIRHFVCGQRQKDIAQNWPFPEKYLKLCLNKGFCCHILPPIGAGASCIPTHHSSSDREKLATMETETNIICTQTCGVDLNTRHNSSAVIELEGAEYAALDHLSMQMNRLSISMDEDEQDGHVCPSSRDETNSKTEALWNHHMYMKKNSKTNNFRVCNDDDKYMKNSSKVVHSRCSGGKRKGRTKKKSLAEIFAVAKHCVLDGFDKVLYVSSGDSFTPCSEGDYLSEEKEAPEAVVGANSNNNGGNSKSKFTEDSLSKKKKKHQRCRDNAATDMYSKPPIKKSRLGAAARASTLPKDQSSIYWQQGKLMSRSCKSSEKPKGYKKKNPEIYGQVQIREYQDHRA